MPTFNKISPIIISGVVLIVINLFFFKSQLTGKKISAPDEFNYIAASTEIHKDSHVNSFWTNSMFSGMPTYQIDKLPLGWNPFDLIKSGFGLFMDPMLSYFLAMSLFCFISLLFMGLSPWLAGLGAFAFSFTSGHFVVAASGHYNKLDALVYLPLLFAGIHLIFNQRRVTGFVLFTIGLIFNIQANHIQMTYYIFLALVMYGVIELIQSIKTKTLNTFLRSSSYVVVAIALSLLANVAGLYTMKDYSEETVRGKRILTPPAVQQVPASGLNWKYASEFSAGYLDLMSMIVPGFVGGSGKETTSTSSAIAKDFNQNNKKVPDPFYVPLYWGSLPFTSGPDYAGILSFALFVIGIGCIKGNYKYWALSAFIFLTIQSLGSHFFLNRFLFDYLPYYNKFRSPNSILQVAVAIVPWFGFYTLSELFKVNRKPQEIKSLFKKTVLPLLAFIVVLMLLGPFLFDFSKSGDKEFWANTEALIDTRIGLLLKESIRSIVLLIGLSVLLYYTLLNKLGRNHFYIALGALLIIDLYPVGKRYLQEDEFKDKEVIKESVSLSDGDLFILKDRDLYYRVMDRANNTFDDAYASLHHRSVGGYHPAKLRRYQDLIDGYLSKGKMSIIHMLNTKYIINKDGTVASNPNAMGNAWFVDTLISVKTPDEEFKALENLDPRHQAVVLSGEFPGYIDQTTFTPNGSINLIEYHADQLRYRFSSSSPQVAVFSEIWYGPDKGWTAYVDGKPVPHIRANYVLRALKIPAGNHTIEFTFYPEKVWLAIKINRIVLWTLSLSLFAGIVYSLRSYSSSQRILKK
jgi:hypothetical protein